MSKAALEIGDKLHIITRRRFEEEVRRAFVGEVTGISGDLQSVEGYAFVFNSSTNLYQKKPELRTRLFSLGKEGFIINKMPFDVVVASLDYCLVDRQLVVTDGAAFSLDINEFGSSR